MDCTFIQMSLLYFFSVITKGEMVMLIINMVNNVLVSHSKATSCITVMHYKSRNDWIINNKKKKPNMLFYHNYLLMSYVTYFSFFNSVKIALVKRSKWRQRIILQNNVHIHIIWRNIKTLHVYTKVHICFIPCHFPLKLIQNCRWCRSISSTGCIVPKRVSDTCITICMYSSLFDLK